MNIDIVHSLKNIDNSIFIIEGSAEANANSIIEDYQSVNPSIEPAVLSGTKHFPHMEDPERFLEQTGIFL